MDEVLFGDLCSSKQSVACLNVEATGINLNSLYVCTEADGQDLSITLTDGEEAWSGRLTEQRLSELARKMNTGPIEFTKQTTKALSGSRSRDQFVYCVNKLSESQLQLSWKKVVGNEGVRIELGSIIANKTSLIREVHCTFLDYLIDKVTSLESEMDQLKEMASCLESERKNTLLKLRDCADTKESLEKSLFGKFRIILNSKKAKIRHLLDKLSDPSAFIASDHDGSSGEDDQPPSPTGPVIQQPISPKEGCAPGPVRRRKRVARQGKSGPLHVPRPPVLQSPMKPPVPSEADSFESDKLLELL